MSDEERTEIIRIVYSAEQAIYNAKQFAQETKAIWDDMYDYLQFSAKSQLEVAKAEVIAYEDIERKKADAAIKATRDEVVAYEDAVKQKAKLRDQEARDELTAYEQRDKEKARLDAEAIQRREQEGRAEVMAYEAQDREIELAFAELASIQEARLRDVAKVNAEVRRTMLQQDREYVLESERLNDQAVQHQITDIQKARLAQKNPVTPTQQAPTQQSGGRNVISNLLRMGQSTFSMSGLPGSGVASGLAQITTNATAAEGAIGGLGTAFAGLATILGPVIGGITELKDSKAFTEALAGMSVMLDNVTGSSAKFSDELERTAEAAVRISVAFNRDLLDVVAGFKDALSRGISSDELEAFSEHAGTLSRALGIDFKEATTVLASFKDAYHLNVSDMAEVTDVLFNTAKLGGLQVGDLTSSFGRLLPIASSADVSIQDLAAGVATLGRNGMTASIAVTSMRSLIQSIIEPSKAARAEFDKFGIEFGQNALEEGGLVGFIDKMKEISNGGDLDIISKFFPEKRTQSAIAALVKADDLLHSMEGAKGVGQRGTATEASDRSMDDGADKFNKVHLAMSGEFQLAGKQLWNSMANIFFGEGPLSDDTLKKVEENIVVIAGVFNDFTIAAATTVKVIGDLVGSVWDLVKGSGNLANIIGDLFTFDFAAAKKDWSDMGKNGDDFVNHLKGAWNDSAQGVKELGKSMQFVTDQIDHIEHSTKSAAEAAADMGHHLIDPFRDVGTAADEASGSIDKLTAKAQKLDEAQVKDHARPAQQELMAGIKDSIADYEVAIETQMQAIQAKLKPSMEALFKNIAEDGLKRGESDDQINKRISDITKRAMDDAVSGSAVPEMKEKLSHLKDALEEIVNEVMLQPTDQEFTAAKKQVDALTAWMLADGNKRREERIKLENEIVTTAESYYKKDASNYEKWQNKKKTDLEKLAKQELKILDDVDATINKLMEEKASSAVKAAGQDPARQRRILQDQLGAAQGAFHNYVDSGGTDKKQADMLLEAVEKITAQLNAAETSLFGDAKAEKDHNEILDDSVKTMQKFREQLKASLDEMARHKDGNAPPSANYASAAARAANDVTHNKEVKQVVQDTKISLNIDGTVSQDTVDRIAAAVQKSMQIQTRQGRLKTPYDNTTWTGGSDNASDDSGDN